MRDVWEKKDLGVHTARFGATMAGHETTALLLSAAATVKSTVKSFRVFNTNKRV